VDAPLEKAELAKKALVPLVPALGSRCPRCGVRLLDLVQPCSRCGVIPASSEAGANLVPEGVFVTELLRGASYVPRGFFKILLTPRLWATAALPSFVNVIIIVLLWFLCWGALEHFLGQYASSESLPTWTGWWKVLAYVIHFTAYVATSGVTKVVMVPLLLTWLMTAPPFTFILRAIFAPLSTIVGERTEQNVLDLPAASKPFNLGDVQTAIVMTIVNSVLLALVQLALYVVLLPLAFVPPVWVLLPPAIMAGMDHSDPSFCRKTYHMRERLALWRARKWRFLGFGLTFFFLLTIPFLNALVFPTVACGAALLYLELDRK
jgi:uncharacterized protein involved in cysteine biosynthesis